MFNPSLFDDPYPAYHALRAMGPLQWSPEFCGGAWLLTGHADVASVLRDPRFSVQRAGGWVNSSGPAAVQELREFKKIFARSLIFADAPRHTRLRRVMNAGFTPAALRAAAPQVQAIVDRLLDEVLAGAGHDAGDGASQAVFEFDFMRDFARPLPALVMAGLLGVEARDRGDFVTWSDDIAAFIGAPTPTLPIARRAASSLAAMSGYFQQLLPQRRAQPGSDLVSLLLKAEAGGGIIGANELLSQCCTLLFAGHETTRNLLGNGMLALLRHPQQWQSLKDSPDLLPSAVRELLRYDSPVQYTGRRLKADVELHGQVMKRGELVIAFIGAANRDPAKFTDPDRLDLRRNEGMHLSFGFGPHVCIGATLTYLEAEIALRAIMRRIPGLALAGPTQSWADNAAYRSLNRLPLRAVRAPAAPQAQVAHA